MEIRRRTIRVPSAYLTATGRLVPGPTVTFRHLVLIRDDGTRTELVPFAPALVHSAN